MVVTEGKEKAVQSFDNASTINEKRFSEFRRGVHQNADILLIIIHSLFPLGVGAYLIAQEITGGLTSSQSVFHYLGYLTGSGGIILQLSMIARALAPGVAANFMDCLVFAVAIFQFLACSVGATLTFVFTGKSHVSVAAISAAYVVFCILPAFLAITSLMNAHTYSKNRDGVVDETSFVSGRLKPPVIIKRTSSDVMHTGSPEKYYLS